ncbi:uncharacterized protein [Onthophagus taurus]|uniref:uncharacterized protein n=1 Tax=Onthophagus taurus TaxID=166361 RepID=UPI0039BE03BD
MYFLKLLLFLIIIIVVRGHFRLIILTVLGLIGLYLAHILAVDYQNITRPTQIIKHLLGKRSLKFVNNENVDSILKNDPIDCFKSYLCQTSTNPDKLNPTEQNITNLTRIFPKLQHYFIDKPIQSSTWKHCKSIYPRCPFNKEIMTKMIEYIDGLKE